MLTLVAISVVTLLVMSSSLLAKQTRTNAQTTAVRNAARGGLQIAAAFLNQQLMTGTPLQPPGTEWAGDGSAAAPYYLVLVGSGPSCARDTTGTYYAPGGTPWSAGQLGVSRAIWLQDAREVLRAGGCPHTWMARVEYQEVGADWYYQVWCVGGTDDPQTRDATSPTILVAQAAMVPENPTPFRYGFAGRQGVVVDGAGTLGTMNPTDGNTDPVVSSNGQISRP